MESYKYVLPSLGGYITQIGRINGERLQKVCFDSCTLSPLFHVQVLDHCSSTEEARVRQLLTVCTSFSQRGASTVFFRQ